MVIVVVVVFFGKDIVVVVRFVILVKVFAIAFTKARLKIFFSDKKSPRIDC